MSKELSKFLSLVLRHDPGKVGISLDSNGWTSIATLVAGVQRAGFPEFDRATLDAVVENNEKKRFTISEDGSMIRAAQGHSVEVDLALQPSTPPDILYHGTASTRLASIREHGLVPGKRQQVHLSNDSETAVKVGSRHGRPVVLVVDAARMAAEGIVFFQADNGVWLTDAVPADYLSTDQA